CRFRVRRGRSDRSSHSLCCCPAEPLSGQGRRPGKRQKDGKVSAVKDGSYVDHLFGLATGWLGWSARDAWSTPIPELLLAYEAKIQFLKATNPFGSAEEKPDKKAVARDVRSGLRVAAALRPGAEG